MDAYGVLPLPTEALLDDVAPDFGDGLVNALAHTLFRTRPTELPLSQARTASDLAPSVCLSDFTWRAKLSRRSTLTLSIQP